MVTQSTIKIIHHSSFSECVTAFPYSLFFSYNSLQWSRQSNCFICWLNFWCNCRNKHVKMINWLNLNLIWTRHEFQQQLVIVFFLLSKVAMKHAKTRQIWFLFKFIITDVEKVEFCPQGNLDGKMSANSRTS